MHDILISVGLSGLAASLYFLRKYFRPRLIEAPQKPVEISPPVVPVPVPTPKLAETVKPVEFVRPRIEPDRPKFLSKEKRREAIRDAANDSEMQKRFDEIRERRQAASGLIPPDPEAQTKQAVWRVRVQNSRG